MIRTSRLRLLSALLVVLMLAAVPAFAQETLPVPAAPEGTTKSNDIIVIIPLTAQPVYPVNNADLSPNQPFSWTSTGADQYSIKVTVKETGAKFTYKPTFSCSGNSCVAVMGAQSIEMFDQLSDGQHIVWRVISHFGDVKLKSEKATATVNEVTPVTPVSPANGSTVALESFKSLSWDGHQSVNRSYQVTVKDLTLGIVVYARLQKNVYNCGLSCSHELYNVYDSFTKGHTYQWMVTAIGESGEKMKSVKATFTLN